MTYEHTLEAHRLCAESHANPDLASPLRYGISNNPINAYDAQHQGHARCDTEHHQRERSPRHGPIINLLQCPYEKHGLVRVDGPNRFLRFSEKTLCRRPVATNQEYAPTSHVHGVGPKSVHHHGPINKRGRVLLDTFVVNIGCHSHDLAPGIAHSCADAFAECSPRSTPHLARHILGN